MNDKAKDRGSGGGDVARGQGHGATIGSEQGEREERQEPIPAQKPSQAEGDRETIDEDIEEKEREGKL